MTKYAQQRLLLDATAYCETALLIDLFEIAAQQFSFNIVLNLVYWTSARDCFLFISFLLYHLFVSFLFSFFSLFLFLFLFLFPFLFPFHFSFFFFFFLLSFLLCPFLLRISFPLLILHLLFSPFSRLFLFSLYHFSFP